MKRPITPYHVGGALYIPATHAKLKQVAINNYYPYLKSIIIDFEDALLEESLQSSLEVLKELLKEIPKQELLIFIRARNTQHLEELLLLDHIEKIDGFVLAKANLYNLNTYFEMIDKDHFWLMPVLESAQLFTPNNLTLLSELLQPQKERILMLRFGGEDISSSLGLKRNCETILYDLPPLVYLLNCMVVHFKPLGYVISAPVYTCFDNEDGFIEEVEKDLLMGLFGKTLIHPHQALLCEEYYKVDSVDFEAASKSLSENAKAIFTHEGMMMETLAHRRWAKEIVKRKEVYGVK